MDGVRIVVPDSLELITPYVLREQQDWFEDEIRFLRRLLEPGMTVIDIGANYGVYTLAMALVVGPTGRVWAFEPAAATADLLAESIQCNGFDQVVLQRSAISSQCGEGRLSLESHCELNALLHGEGPDGTGQAVAVVSLDSCIEPCGWTDIDVVKLDAEGEESEILRGGEGFFRSFSPLVQYEVKAGDDWHLDLVRQFADLGYHSYRLVPGQDLLVPFDPGLPVDRYLLNLFACRPDRAERLAHRGWLLPVGAVRRGLFSADGDPDPGLLPRRPEDHWERSLAAFPYAQELGPFWRQWRQALAAGESGLERALALHALSRDPTQPAAVRFEALAVSLGLLRRLAAEKPGSLRLASLARVAREYGARSLAVSSLHELATTILRESSLDLQEPFLVPCERFEALAPAGALAGWTLAAVLEELERLAAFSTYYTGPTNLPRLQHLMGLGFDGPEMRRRRELIGRRFGSPSSGLAVSSPSSSRQISRSP